MSLSTYLAGVCVAAVPNVKNQSGCVCVSLLLAPPVCCAVLRRGVGGGGGFLLTPCLRVLNCLCFSLQFVDFCSQHIPDHLEVITYLTSRHQKTTPQFLASVEFRNMLGRCLSRVRAKSSKVYVYIKELCTIFKAHSQKRKLALNSSVAAAPASAPSAPEASAAPAGPSEPQAEPPKPQGSSKRKIRYLENLLQVYAVEIRRLQERELDLEELDREDSAYLQESRLKRRMMHIFERLCKLKDCNSLTGRVIEQRIPYRGTRYPEVNRRIERLINHPEAFPDYTDILKVVQKANVRHSLGLPKRQMEGMAADAFREVGNRLQERRHLDLVYNFGSHLTDQYRPGERVNRGRAERRLGPGSPWASSCPRQPLKCCKQ